MRVWDFISSRIQRRNTPDLTIVRDWGLRFYGYGRAAVTQLESARINVNETVRHYILDEETRNNLVREGAVELLPFLPGGRLVYNIVLRSVGDGGPAAKRRSLQAKDQTAEKQKPCEHLKEEPQAKDQTAEKQKPCADVKEELQAKESIEEDLNRAKQTAEKQKPCADVKEEPQAKESIEEDVNRVKQTAEKQKPCADVKEEPPAKESLEEDVNRVKQVKEQTAEKQKPCADVKEELQAKESIEEDVNRVEQGNKISAKSVNGSENPQPLKRIPNEGNKESDLLKTDKKRVFSRSRL